MRYLLALDQGTTSSRALVFDDRAALLGMAQQEHPQIYPEPGWVEHDPELLWETQVRTARRVLAEHGVSGRDIAAIGISNQRETTLLWERDGGRPLANAIVWQDRRTAPHCERLREAGLEPIVRDKTGLLLDPYFSATELAWLLDHVPGARRRAERGELCFWPVDSYLLFRLTGGAVHAIDYSNASRTLLFDIHTLAWDEDLGAAYLQGSIFVTGAAVQWLRDASGLIRDAAETEALARSVPDNGTVYPRWGRPTGTPRRAVF